MGLLYLGLFLAWMVLVLVVVVRFKWWWWWWLRSGGGSGGDSLCKGGSCNSCRNNT